MATKEAIDTAIARYYNRLMASWTNQTAHPNSRPEGVLPPGRPMSLGQCAVSSIVLLRQLRHDYPYRRVRLASGDVWAVRNQGLSSVMSDHVWVEDVPSALQNRPEELDQYWIYDVTADQAQGIDLPPLVIASYERLVARGLLYRAWNFYDHEQDFAAALPAGANIMPRVDILQGNFDRVKG